MALRFSVLASSAILLFTGCAGPSVDLVAIPPSEAAAVQFYGPDIAKLQLRVKNQGMRPAPSSPVVVEFFLPTLIVTSPPQDAGVLQAGESSNILGFEIPQGCVDSGCGFRIKVDPLKQIKESNESNNNVRGNYICETAKK